MIGNLAEYSDKTENDVADAASRAEASMQLMEIGIASYSMKNVVLYRSTSGSGNLSEPWLKCFSGEYSDKGVSSQYLRPNIHPIYQECLRALEEESYGGILRQYFSLGKMLQIGNG